MATLPRDGYPAWASTLRADPLTSTLNKEQPDIGIQNEGLVVGEPIKRDHLNWQFDSIARWIEHQDLALLGISIRLDALDGKGIKEHITVGIGELHSTSELSAITELHL
ncbi:MAG: hypothetical protein GY820_28125 [Gammaproteobacteria bacterium]|nr:hypothetical protein [Gammaproteobacteria bacterium]